eukprot:04483.XXX_64400_64209_1 [CDS] Oithona nana genome sequencing.
MEYTQTRFFVLQDFSVVPDTKSYRDNGWFWYRRMMYGDHVFGR